MTVFPIGRGDDRLAMARRRIVAAVTQADLRPMSRSPMSGELAARLTEQPAPDVVISCAAGRLGFEKYEIGRRMKEICAAGSLPHDIAMDNASHIYGDAWFEFLGSSRTMLGCESGSNAFDFDGRLDEAIQTFTGLHGRRPAYQEFKDVLDPLERANDLCATESCADWQAIRHRFRNRLDGARARSRRAALTCLWMRRFRKAFTFAEPGSVVLDKFRKAIVEFDCEFLPQYGQIGEPCL
jgi:hypothetical protein